MKNIIVLISVILLSSCSKVTETRFSIASEQVILIITENTTKTELTEIAADLKAEKNIDIDFSESEFYKDGRIERLNLAVDCNDGYRGIARTTGKILKSKNSGFSRNYAEGASDSFVIGAM